MVRSMTGYGRASRIENGYSVTTELRSVNHRYFDCNIHLPRMYAYLEESVKQRISRDIGRGKVDVFITIELVCGAGETVSLNAGIAEGYIAALRELAAKFSLAGEPSLMDIAHMPEVLNVERAEADEDALKALTLGALDEAMAGYLEMSRREGENMKSDILGRADRILGSVERLEARSAVTVPEYREKLLARMQDVLADTSIDESRILAEAALFADKTAVDEETVRLRSHVAQLRELMSGGGQIGRKLDFLIQEFNREANTIGSKANDLTMTREVIDLKSEIEKIREQIQNIE